MARLNGVRRRPEITGKMSTAMGERKQPRREGENEIGRGKSGQVATIEEAILDRWHGGRLADALLLDSKD